MDAQPKAGGCPFSEKARRFDMFEAPYQTDPAEALRFAREGGEPVFYSEAMGYWIVTRYDDVKAVFRDPITFSPRNALEKLSPTPPEAETVLRRYNYGMNRTLVNEDEPVHMERRRALLDAFAPAALESHRAMVRDLIETRIDAFIEKGRVDLVPALLWEVPLTVALHFLGVPEEDMETLRRFSVAHTVNTWGRPTPEQQVAVAENVGQFWTYAGEVLARMKADPDGRGWMQDMIAKNRVMPEVVTDNYLHSMMMAIIVAAHETTSLASANTIRTLLSRPELWRKLCETPALIPAAVEEVLRHTGSVVAWRRQATRDATVGGVAIPEGAKLFLATACANHDPRHFENADDLDIFRDNAADHLTFGYGAHQCMGKNLGRMEVCAMVEALTRRLPGLRLAEQSFSYLPNVSFRGPEAVWVEWDVAARPRTTRAAATFPIGAPDVTAIARPLIVESVAPAADGVIAVTLVSADGAPLPGWTPGAHVELVLPNGEARKYSLCGEPGGAYLVAIQREEAGRGGSLWLHETLRPGMTLPVRGPKNFFRHDAEAPFHLLVAGGIGVTPILAMADALRAAGRPYRLIYTGRERARMALLDRVAAHGDKATIHLSGESGRLDPEALFAALPQGAQLCACGPQSLLAALAEASLRHPHARLHVEHFSGAPVALDPARERAFAVDLLDSGVSLAVGAGETLLDALARNGVDVAHDCREGLCGSCEVEVVEGDVDHRDRVLTAAERAQGRRMMACCSRVKGRAKLRL